MDENNLMENVRSFFTEQYKGMENSNSFLSFEPLGSMIDPEDFKDENDGISDIKATEQLSILGDRLPQIDNVFFANTSRLSNVYEELIESTVFSGIKINTEDKTPYINKFSEVRSQSIFKLNEGKKASITTPEGRYLPVYGFPKKWYDPESPFWVTKTFSAKENGGPTPTKAPAKSLKPLPFVWRTKLMASPQILEAVQAVGEEKSSGVAPKNIKIKSALNVRPINNPKFMRKEKVTSTLDRATLFNTRLASIPVIKKDGISSEAEGITAKAELKNFNILKRFNVADRVKLTGHMVNSDTAPVKPVQSNEFSMSFAYCIVYLDRPWFDTSMFHYTNLWYCLSLKEDYFSTGDKDETNSGVLKCIPSAMVLIKDLRIRAAWTADDKANAQNSIGLGIFNVNGSKFIDNELVTPGMQIIGWMCEVIPRLPTISDPNILS